MRRLDKKTIEDCDCRYCKYYRKSSCELEVCFMDVDIILKSDRRI
ncbi:hypothetical protein EUAN_01640 [Andreesenia angusta]|uniref:DUF1540 domain-containing protein n=1 Tax=Andreesenia angusta TaxID=39480 RepID=A0A1S1VA59_9FIRM|nr:hypothetical protein EUAN_01640 [Andreesenia angusta]